MKELLEQLGFKDERGVYLPMLSVFELENHEFCDWDDNKYRFNMNQYRDFITQPLTKGMFVPCDEDGNVLEELEIFGLIENIGGINANATEVDHEKHKQYLQAQERVLFKCERWTMGKQHIIDEHKTIEQAINNRVKLYLK